MLRTVLLALTIVLSMFPVILAGIPSDNEYLFAKVILWLGDLPALALAVVAAPLVVRSIRSGPLLRTPVLWAALVLVEGLAFVVHPSAEGVQTILRLITTLAIVASVVALRMPSERRLIVGVLAVTAAVQTLIAILQTVHGAPIGLAMLGESQDPLVTAGNAGEIVAPEGTVLHPHILASLALVAYGVVTGEIVSGAWTAAWSLAAVVAVAPAGFTYSRAALSGAVLAGAALSRGAWLRRPAYRIAIATLLVGFGVPALIGIAGWTTRAEVGLDVSRRDELLSQTIVLVEEHPLTGVGPGRQLSALRELRDRQPGVVTYLNAVHDVPLTVAVEAGIAGLIVSSLLFVAVGYRALKAGGPALALFVAYVPFVLLDHFPFTHQHGLVLTGLWLGFIELTADRAAG